MVCQRVDSARVGGGCCAALSRQSDRASCVFHHATMPDGSREAVTVSFDGAGLTGGRQTPGTIQAVTVAAISTSGSRSSGTTVTPTSSVWFAPPWMTPRIGETSE